MFNEEKQLEAPIYWGMIGGGRGSEIGYAHRASSSRDHFFHCVAGAFDLDADRCLEFGQNLKINSDRCYPNYQTLLTQEAQRPDGIQAITIATPNSTHFTIAKACLEAGLHVICEKPIALELHEAQELRTIAQQRHLLLGVMYGYSGYPMIHQAKAMVERGDLGDIRVINTQFAHGFHASEASQHGNPWRMNPTICGKSYVLNDVGTHAFFLAQFIGNLEVSALLCTRQSFVKGRAPLEDNAQVLLKYRNGAVGNIWASAINAGSSHQQKIRIVGEKASLEWWDEYPNQLRYEIQGQPVQILERGMHYLYEDVDFVNHSRIGAGHPEGFFSAWANVYHRFGEVINTLQHQDVKTASTLWYPNADTAVEGVRFVNLCCQSADAGSIWIDNESNESNPNIS